MHQRDLLTAIVNDARGWLEAWAKDFTDAEATATADRSRRLQKGRTCRKGR